MEVLAGYRGCLRVDVDDTGFSWCSSPADSDEDERPRRSRAAGTRKDNHGLRRDNEKEEQESKGWSLPSSPELLMLFCSILICVVAAKYLENLPMIKDRVGVQNQMMKYFPADEFGAQGVLSEGTSFPPNVLERDDFHKAHANLI